MAYLSLFGGGEQEFINIFSDSEDGSYVIWQEEGILVSDHLADETECVVSQASEDGCIISWMDETLFSSAIEIQQLTPDGNPIWDEEGQQIVTGLNSNATLGSVVRLNDGTCSFIWTEGRNTNQSFFQVCRDEGEEVTMAFEYGHQITDENDRLLTRPKAIADGNGGLIIVWVNTLVAKKLKSAFRFWRLNTVAS